ncbi:putative disease resistance protein RGA4 [Dendrobium catenatum]|nr:putative disease resistance protein RGA4 [Dendrobium catenatum]
MAEMSLDPIMEKIISFCFRYVEDQVRWKRRTKEELRRLREKYPKIQAVVHFASSQEQITEKYPALKEWLWQLQDAIDDADDVVDELEYMELEKQLAKNKKLRRVRSIMKSMKKKLVKIGNRVIKRDPNFKRLEEAVQKLDEVSAYVTNFLKLFEGSKQEQEQEVDFYRTRETGYLPKNDLIGRLKHKEFVMQWLRKPSNESRTTWYRNISILSIVGHGGMGKTTLLQHVYEDEMTKQFDLKMWVCVSNNFDAKKVIADMLECLKKERPRLETLGPLQGVLKEELMSKKFLLVLDDIWVKDEEKDKSKWEDVLAPVVSGGFGSKILVTTRTDSVALIFAEVIQKEVEKVKLEGLDEDECLQLLNSHAFAGVENPPDDYKKLRAIAEEIVKKLLGSPLAAKVIGGVLKNNLDERHWRTVLESDLLDQNSINSILRLSYIVLPNHLQNCFAFCCMFPQDHTYYKDDIVRMWIALGFIQPFQGTIMEDIGERYFNVLVKKNLIDKVGDDYKMHNLIHESASKLFAQKCGKLVVDKESPLNQISETIRHLSVQTTNLDILRKIEKFKHLHSLFLFYEDSNQDLGSALTEIFKASRCMRLLYIRTDHKLEMIPEEIIYLKYLRYLKIERVKSFRFNRLPRSLSNLYHLLYIIYGGPGLLIQPEDHDFLSSEINNLSNLRYLELPVGSYFVICGIGKLKFLQELNMFEVRDVSGYRIGELENMNDLCKLGINCLQNVKDAEEACSAKLCEKRRLTNLDLRWSDTDSRNINLDEYVLDKLQPPKGLRNLSVWSYRGARSAKWMNNVNSIFNLEKIELRDCLEWETLPPFGQLPFLKSLKLSGMPKVKWLESKFNGNDKYRAFPLLEELYIYGLEALEDWFEAGVAAEDGCLFPCLTDLVLYNCPKLKELPSLPSELKSLTIHNNMEWTTLNFRSNSNPIPLETLYVAECPNIISLPLADEIARLAALRKLKIEECPNLISLGEMQTSNNCHLMLSDLSISDPLVLLMEPLRSIASLKKLTIENNDEMGSFPNEAEQLFLKDGSSLCELEFLFLKSLESLPSSLEGLSSLQSLCIFEVPMLRELPNLPPNLEFLSIICGECHPEFKERYREDGGSDRHKIAHIPHMDIRAG